MLLFVGTWGRVKPCDVDSFRIEPVGTYVLGLYGTRHTLWVTTEVGGALYRPAEDPYPLAVFPSWQTFQYWAIPSDTLPPVLYRFHGDTLELGRVDEHTGTLVETLRVPGLPPAHPLFVAPTLNNRFWILYRRSSREVLQSLVLVTSLIPLALVDSFSVGIGGFSATAFPRTWPSEDAWIVPFYAPFNRGLPGWGIRDDMGGETLISLHNLRPLQVRMFPWPLFAQTALFCDPRRTRCILTALPSPHTPPGVRGRAWLLRMPHLEVEKAWQDIHPARIRVPLASGILDVDFRAGTGWRISASGDVLPFSLPVALPDGWIVGATADPEGIWVLLRSFPPYTPDPRGGDEARNLRFLDLFHLSPRGVFYRRLVDHPPDTWAGRGILHPRSGELWVWIHRIPWVADHRILRIRCS